MTRQKACDLARNIEGLPFEFEDIFDWWCRRLAACENSSAYMWNDQAHIDQACFISNNDKSLSHTLSVCVPVCLSPSISLTHTHTHTHTHSHSHTHTHTHSHSKQETWCSFLRDISCLLDIVEYQGLYLMLPSCQRQTA
jgi:hypothetical protein